MACPKWTCTGVDPPLGVLYPCRFSCANEIIVTKHNDTNLLCLFAKNGKLGHAFSPPPRPCRTSYTVTGSLCHEVPTHGQARCNHHRTVSGKLHGRGCAQKHNLRPYRPWSMPRAANNGNDFSQAVASVPPPPCLWPPSRKSFRCATPPAPWVWLPAESNYQAQGTGHHRAAKGRA